MSYDAMQMDTNLPTCLSIKYIGPDTV